MTVRVSVAIGLLAAWVVVPALGAMPPAPATAPSVDDALRVEQAIRGQFRERFPEVEIRAVHATVWPGVYEIVGPDEIFYADATGDHVISGAMIDTRSKQNLTELRWNELNRIDFQSLPLARAIKVVRGDGSRVLAVFADPDCPYCRKLEQALQGVTNITVYTFLFPIAELHPEAPRHAVQVWCSSDAAASWAAWMLQRTPLKGEGCANDPIGELAALGAKLEITGTPTMFLADGTRVRGSIEQDQIEQLLSGVATRAVAQSAAQR
jgi:thiol:disulfide interchange protein DsbC